MREVARQADAGPFEGTWTKRRKAKDFDINELQGSFYRPATAASKNAAPTRQSLLLVGVPFYWQDHDSTVTSGCGLWQHIWQRKFKIICLNNIQCITTPRTTTWHTHSHITTYFHNNTKPRVALCTHLYFCCSSNEELSEDDRQTTSSPKGSEPTPSSPYFGVKFDDSNSTDQSEDEFVLDEPNDGQPKIRSSHSRRMR